MNRFAGELKAEIEKGLPGTEVQWSMASSDRFVKNFPRIPEKDSLEAGVLILLYPRNRNIYTAFIQRPDYQGVHGGQISFPGGKKEASDADLVSTAKRESAEEIAINPSDLEIVGILTPLYIPVSRIVVTPVVAWTNRRPAFRPDPAEVEYIIEAPLDRFLNRSIIRTGPWQVRGENLTIRYFGYDGHVIWGATAMILQELLVIITRAGLSPRE
ncbi:MAG TPA: CoA pyrophosphatase [Bacteroidales bacterium]|nr:CoA pyrophosphatase [Bacteroidales bacterium]